MIKKEKKGLSPIVATILLIALVVIIAMIIFLWAKGFVKESIMKRVNGVEMNTQQACDQIQLTIREYTGGIQIINNGNVPVSGFDIKIISSGSSEVINERNKNLGKGQSFNYPITSYDNIEIKPVLLGTVKGVEKLYTCQNSFVPE